MRGTRRNRRHALLPIVMACSLAAAAAPAAQAYTYTVRPGDSLYLIAQRHGVSLSALRQANGLWSDYIEAGARITIPDGNGATGSSGTSDSPRASTPAYAAPAGQATYTVRPGDTLYLIAQRYGTTVDELRRLNSQWSDYLEVGQRLVVPSRASSSNPSSDQPPVSGSRPARPETGTPASRGGAAYTVRRGDTLYKLAQRFGVSVAAIKEANGLRSDWLQVGQVLSIPQGGGRAPVPGPAGIRSVDRDLLARLVYAEAAGEPFEGQVAVAATVLNRMKSSRYPDSVSGVVYQVVDGRYQYSPVLDGRIHNTPDATAYRAVDAALNGWDPTNGATGFYNPAKVSWDSWVRQHPIIARIGNHVFFRY